MIDKATPLHCAALAGNLENCKLILKHIKKASKKGKIPQSAIDPPDQANMSPLHLACLGNKAYTESQRNEVIQCLALHGADPTLENT